MPPVLWSHLSPSERWGYFPLCSPDSPFSEVVVTVLSWQWVCSYSFYNHLPSDPRVKDEMPLSPSCTLSHGENLCHPSPGPAAETLLTDRIPKQASTLFTAGLPHQMQPLLSSCFPKLIPSLSTLISDLTYQILFPLVWVDF